MLTEFSPSLDVGIAAFVNVLAENGAETYESCQGGEGHCVPYPMVRFHGDIGEGHRVLAVAISSGLPVARLNRVWSVVNGEPTGPEWELVFHKKENANG